MGEWKTDNTLKNGSKNAPRIASANVFKQYHGEYFWLRHEKRFGESFGENFWQRLVGR